MHPSIYPFIHAPIYLPIHPPTHPCTHLSTHPSIHLPTHSSTHICTHLSINLYIYPPNHLPISSLFQLLLITYHINLVSSFCQLEDFTSALHAYARTLFWTTWWYTWITLPLCLSLLMSSTSLWGVLLPAVWFSNTKKPSQSLHTQKPPLLDSHTWGHYLPALVLQGQMPGFWEKLLYSFPCLLKWLKQANPKPAYPVHLFFPWKPQ